MQQIKTLIDLIGFFPDHQSCREFLEERRWRGVSTCPHCRLQSKSHYRLTSKGEFHGLYKCHRYRRRFTVTVGTMFEDCHIPLDRRFYAILCVLVAQKRDKQHTARKGHRRNAKDRMVRTFVVPNTKAAIFRPLVRTLVEKGSTIIIDGYYSYKGLTTIRSRTTVAETTCGIRFTRMR